MNNMEIEGLDLKTDRAVQELCVSSNNSSNSTRSVLYVMMIVSILAFAAILNSYLYNWSYVRIGYYFKQHNKYNTLLSHYKAKQENNHNGLYTDSVQIFQDSVDYYKTFLQARIRDQIENNQNVKTPFLGNTFDVNDMGIILGVTFTLLLLIARATIAREINNLKLTLHAITERYPDHANEDEFKAFIKAEMERVPDHNITPEDVLYCINYTRREHHYNFLSMNEIFTFPPLKTGDEYGRMKVIKVVAQKIFWIPFFVYFCCFVNDLSTIDIGWALSIKNTVILFACYLVFMTLIVIESNNISHQKDEMLKIYTNFKRSNYKYDKQQVAQVQVAKQPAGSVFNTGVSNP